MTYPAEEDEPARLAWVDGLERKIAQDAKAIKAASEAEKEGPLPISLEPNEMVRQQRLDAVERDLALRATGAPCTGCGNTARVSGGTGCKCSNTQAVIDRLWHLAGARDPSTYPEPW